MPIILSRQNHRNVCWVLNAHYNLSGDGEKVLIGGVYYRSSDAVIPMIGLGFKDYTFHFHL